MITLCCFSRNRPMQLAAMLDSLELNAGSTFSDVRVVWKADNMKFRRGYNVVMDEWEGRVKFIEETTVSEMAVDLVKSFNDYFCWATDDSLFYRKFNITEEMLQWAFERESAISLNLRIGTNVVWQNHWHSEKCPEIPVKNREHGLISWDSSNISVQNDVGRLWQNDASIMPRDMYLDRMLKENHWQNSVGCRGLDNIGQSGSVFNPRVGSSLETSVYVNVPVNLVHYLDDGRLFADNWGKFRQYPVTDLQQLFDTNVRIDVVKTLEQLPDKVDCGRVELEYVFT